MFASTYGPAWISCAEFAYYRSLDLSLRTIQKKCLYDSVGQLSEESFPPRFDVLNALKRAAAWTIQRKEKVREM